MSKNVLTEEQREKLKERHKTEPYYYPQNNNGEKEVKIIY